MSKWKAAFYESVASALAFGGALVLGFGLFPLLNPIQWNLNWGKEYAVAAYLSASSGVLTMYLAWCLTRCVQKCKKEESQRQVADPAKEGPF
jgi:hypothetical protein